MGRKPVGKRAMTPAERQARRRKRLRKEHSVEVRRRKRLMREEKIALAHKPMPPGITYYRKVAVSGASGRSLSPAASAICIEVDGGKVAIVS